MYVPKPYKVDDRKLLVDVLREHPFADLAITGDEGLPELCRTIFLLYADDSELRFHMALDNPVCPLLRGQKPSRVMFSGSHAYISPSWYAHPTQHVPTWSYVSVEVTLEAVEELGRDDTLEFLSRLSREYEATIAGDWLLETSNQKYVDRLLQEMVAFRVPLTKMQGCFRLNQNRSPKDYESITRALCTSDQPGSTYIGEWMKRIRG